MLYISIIKKNNCEIKDLIIFRNDSQSNLIFTEYTILRFNFWQGVF